MSDLQFAPDGTTLGFTLAVPGRPADVFSLTDVTPAAPLRRADDVVRWTVAETGGIPVEQFVKPTLVKYKSFDGQEIQAFLHAAAPAAGRPAGTPRPVVVLIHGGPEAQYRPTFDGLAQYLTRELGINVLCPNVRGSAGYGKTFLTLDDAAKRQDSVKDIGSLLDWIATQPALDRTKVAVYGGSYGGFMVLASLAAYGDRLAAGVDIVGIADFETFLQRTAPYRRDLRRAEYGDERDPAMQAVFRKISPARLVDRITSPLMVVHGKNDPRVPFFEAEQIAAKVRAAGRPVWTVYAANEGHGFAKKENRDFMNAAAVQFFAATLLGPTPKAAVAAPAPAAGAGG